MGYDEHLYIKRKNSEEKIFGCYGGYIDYDPRIHQINWMKTVGEKFFKAINASVPYTEGIDWRDTDPGFSLFQTWEKVKADIPFWQSSDVGWAAALHLETPEAIKLFLDVSDIERKTNITIDPDDVDYISMGWDA